MEKYSDQIGNLLSDESFLRWLSGKANDHESRRWNDWACQDIENQRLVEEARLLWEIRLYEPSPLPDISQKLTELETVLEKKSSVKEKAAREPLSWLPSFRKSWLPGRIPLTVGIAALGVLLFILYQVTPVQQWLRYRTISTDYGEQKHISLPDGSTVILNAHSSLRFLSNWDAGSKRECYLKGEAYFDVQPLTNEHQTEFTVSTRDGRVSVVGTRFVVRDRGTGSRVMVEEGIVKITAVDSTGKSLTQDVTAIVKPGQYVSFKKGDRNLTPLQAPQEPHIAWWGDYLILREAPFREIVEHLEETYGLTILVKNPTLLDHTITGSIEKSDLDLILLTLAEALQAQVVREKQTVIFKKLPL